jgi:hypothetical protein
MFKMEEDELKEDERIVKRGSVCSYVLWHVSLGTLNVKPSNATALQCHHHGN